MVVLGQEVFTYKTYFYLQQANNIVADKLHYVTSLVK